MTELETNLRTILEEKNNKVLPENIKKDVTMFGVEGTAELEDKEFIASFISSIDDTAGSNVTKLPIEMTSIRSYAFYNCTNIALTKLPDSLTSIGRNAFQDCTRLALTELPEGLVSIGDYCFQDCTSLALTELPEGITRLGWNTFMGCTNLALTKLPNNMTTLVSSVFRECTKLALTELPEGITTLASNNFYKCTSLVEIACKGRIASLSSHVFYGCSSLIKFAMPNIIQVPTLSNANTFTDTPIANGTGFIYVPDDLVESFKTATNWSTYVNQIKPISEMEVKHDS